MLKAQDITIRFNERVILDHVSLELASGDRLALLGPSGSGKTTLLRILAGLQAPSCGVVSIDGASGAKSIEELWPQITLVFQDLRLFPHISALANCLIGIDETSAIDRVRSMSSYLGIEHCLDRRPAFLSQGECQRVALIRALIRNPKYLLLDEPTSALDSITTDLMIALLKDLGEEMGILFVTHDIRLASELGTSLTTLRDGKTSVEDIENYRKVFAAH